MELALAMQAAAKDTLELQGGKESEVNKINNEKRKSIQCETEAPW